MISFFRACDSQIEQDAKSAAVCSRPPSEVGAGITEVEERVENGWESGRR